MAVDKEEMREVLKKWQENENRRIILSNSIRCLDCTGFNTSIEHVESPIARDQRQMISQLIRLGYTDKEIYKEISGVFGRHSIITLNFTDPFSVKEEAEGQARLTRFAIGTIFIPTAFLVFRKFFLRK